MSWSHSSPSAGPSTWPTGFPSAYPPVGGPPPHWQQQPLPSPSPRRRNPAALVLLALSVLTVLAIAGAAVAFLIPTKPAAVVYQNDDYQPPPPDSHPPALPQPTDAAQAETWLTGNAIYQQQIPAPVRCEVPRIAAATASDEVLMGHFNQMLDCLMRVWQPPLTAAGFIPVRPSITIYGENMKTACGDGPGINAFYCPLDQQIYFSRLYAQRSESVQKSVWSVEITIAHEFGHALQGRMGIWPSYYLLVNRMTTKPDQLRFTRRSEAQADCFSALFLRSVSRSIGLQQTDVDALLENYYLKGADVLLKDPNAVSTHPRGASRRYWGQTGLSTADAGSCNTWVAGADLVQ